MTKNTPKSGLYQLEDEQFAPRCPSCWRFARQLLEIWRCRLADPSGLHGCLATSDRCVTWADKMGIITQRTSVTSFGCGKTMTVMVPVWMRCILDDRPTSGILCTLCVPPSCFRCLYTLSPAILMAAWCSPPENRQIVQRLLNHKFTQRVVAWTTIWRK